jgi:hypothetical protein
MQSQGAKEGPDLDPEDDGTTLQLLAQRHSAT